MGREAIAALSVCLLALGLAGVVSGDDQIHDEPQQVTATCTTTSALVSWAAMNNVLLSGYDVYRKVSIEAEYIRANSVLVTGPQYLVTGLNSGTEYSFAVRAVYSDGFTSAMSTPATCATG